MKYRLELYNDNSGFFEPFRIIAWSNLPREFKLPYYSGDVDIYQLSDVVQKKTITIGKYIYSKRDKLLSKI